MENTNQREPVESKPKFTLSRTNKAFLLIAIAFTIVWFAPYGDTSGFAIGQFLGVIISYILWPLLISWLAWALSGGRDRAGTIAFNIALALTVLAQVNLEIERSNKKKDAVTDVRNELANLKQEMRNVSEDPNRALDAASRFIDKTTGTLDDLAKNSTGDEKRFYTIMAEYIKDGVAKQQAWHQAIDALGNAQILEFSRVRSRPQIARQKQVVEQFIEQTNIHREYISGGVERLAERLRPLGPDSQWTRGAIDGVREQRTRQLSVWEPLLDCYIKYAESLKGVLNILDEEHGKWNVGHSGPILENELKHDTLLLLFENITALERRIQSLSRQLAETLQPPP
ncbi:MAG: hypothetical protein ACYS8Z_12280 [Planctomycetota bacterium]|jgi:hypothetical protein